jgi:hypothetical protein
MPFPKIVTPEMMLRLSPWRATNREPRSFGTYR